MSSVESGDQMELPVVFSQQRSEDAAYFCQQMCVTIFKEHGPPGRLAHTSAWTWLTATSPSWTWSVIGPKVLTVSHMTQRNKDTPARTLQSRDHFPVITGKGGYLSLVKIHFYITGLKQKCLIRNMVFWHECTVLNPDGTSHMPPPLTHATTWTHLE